MSIDDLNYTRYLDAIDTLEQFLAERRYGTRENILISGIKCTAFASYSVPRGRPDLEDNIVYQSNPHRGVLSWSDAEDYLKQCYYQYFSSLNKGEGEIDFEIGQKKTFLLGVSPGEYAVEHTCPCDIPGCKGSLRFLAERPCFNY